MKPGSNGIERRLDELNERLARLEPLRGRSRADFDADPYLRDIVERNLEVAAQCVIDICHRIISLVGSQKPADYYEAILRMGELGILEPGFARGLAPLASFRNILAHEYVTLDWDKVYAFMGRMDELKTFHDLVRDWLLRQDAR